MHGFGTGSVYKSFLLAIILLNKADVFEEKKTSNLSRVCRYTIFLKNSCRKSFGVF